MTPESFLWQLEQGSEDSLILMLANASEKERKAASAVVINRLDRDIEPYVRRGLTPAQARRVMFGWALVERKIDMRPLLAVLGTSTLAEIKRYGVIVPPKAYEVLAARKPKWLPQWCQWILASNHQGWPVVRRLVRNGLCERPESDEYYLQMLNGGGFGRARQLLEDDPALLEHEVWELFRRQGTRDASLAHDYGGWSAALAALSAEGRIDRCRLLDASLEALELPFKPYHTTWYRNFHEALKPTVKERAERLPLYLALASSPVPATTKFALKAIEAVEKAGALPLEGFLASAEPVLTGKEKGTAATALRLVQRAVTADPGCRPRVLELAAAALEHPAAEIQLAAFELVERLGPATPEVMALVTPRLGLASAPLRQRVEQWCGAGTRIETECYAPGWSMPDPLACEPAIHPIEDVEDLVLLMTRVMNQGGPPDDVERVLDGLSRLCAQRTPRFEDLTSALRHQVLKRFDSGYQPHIAGVYSVELCMAQLAAAWLLDKLAISLGRGPHLLNAALGVRPYWVAVRARRKQPRALLSAPSHAGGWLDPVLLAGRLAAQGFAEPREVEADLIQALFRMAPGHRGEALEAACGLEGEFGDVLRYALGGDTIPPQTTALWQAAAHTRHPIPTNYRLQWGHAPYSPDVLRATMGVTPVPAQDVLKLADLFAAETQPAAKADRLLGIFEIDPVLRSGCAGPDLLAWASLIWPGNRERWCALGAFRIVNNLDWSNANWANREFLRVFEDPYCPMDRMAHLLLGLGLMAREATEFDLARNGLVRLIGDGRLDCRQLGAELAGLFADGIVRGARLAKAFTDTARMSARHADAVRQVTEHALARGLPQRPADQSALLEAFLEACTACGAGPASGDLRRLLGAVSGSGKGPKLARSLLALR